MQKQIDEEDNIPALSSDDDEFFSKMESCCV